MGITDNTFLKLRASIKRTKYWTFKNLETIVKKICVVEAKVSANVSAFQDG